MNTLFNVNWSTIVASLGGLFVAAFLLLSIIYVQVWRHRTDRARRAVRGAGQIKKNGTDMRFEGFLYEGLLREYLENAKFSNEGNPNFGWQKRFPERTGAQ